MGIAHPPPHNDPRKGGVFPLGCGICRSEKLEVIQKYKTSLALDGGVKEAPKAWIYQKKEGPQIIYPDVEIEVPEFIARADEILEEEEAREAERREEERKRLAKLPIKYLSLKEQAKKRRKAERKAEAAANEALIPAFILDPKDEEEVDEIEANDPIVKLVKPEPAINNI